MNVVGNQIINIGGFHCYRERQNVEFSNGKYQNIGIIMRRLPLSTGVGVKLNTYAAVDQKK